MASSPSFANYLVTQEQFNMFHNIDRLLFTRLVHSLGRDPGESMQVIAFWIWLEQVRQCRDLVANMLTWPATLITSLADEALLVLTCIENNKNIDDVHVPLTQQMTKDGVSLKYFHENRLAIIHGVTRNINEVCAKAFVDILPHVLFPTVNDIAVQRSVLRSNEMVEMLGRLGIISSSSDEQEMNKEELLPQDERTIFLTFSKGYPISEIEIKDFFTRNFGECIETVYMQEVAATEQPLYARLVLYSASVMEVVLDGKSKAKFSINGKHVWARKFVRRNHRSPPRS